MKLEVQSLIIEGESAALEADWSGRIIANGANIKVPMVYLFGVRGGKIMRAIDDVVIPSAG